MIEFIKNHKIKFTILAIGILAAIILLILAFIIDEPSPTGTISIALSLSLAVDISIALNLSFDFQIYNISNDNSTKIKNKSIVKIKSRIENEIKSSVRDSFNNNINVIINSNNERISHDELVFNELYEYLADVDAIVSEGNRLFERYNKTFENILYYNDISNTADHFFTDEILSNKFKSMKEHMDKFSCILAQYSTPENGIGAFNTHEPNIAEIISDANQELEHIIIPYRDIVRRFTAIKESNSTVRSLLEPLLSELTK